MVRLTLHLTVSTTIVVAMAPAALLLLPAALLLAYAYEIGKLV
jgi:hypothetical protein